MEERVLKIMSELWLNSYDLFARDILVKPSDFSDFLKGKSSDEIISLVKNNLIKIYKINPEWLETGIGPIFQRDKARAFYFSRDPKIGEGKDLENRLIVMQDKLIESQAHNIELQKEVSRMTKTIQLLEFRIIEMDERLNKYILKESS